MARNLSPELLRRLDALDGCAGRWIVDCRELEGNSSYALRSLQDSSFWPTEAGPAWAAVRPEASPYRSGSLEAAAEYCAATGWRSRLLFCSQWLDDDARWPGGYDAPSIIRSNARCFREEHAKALELADGDADGLSLDVRYVNDAMLETLAALESYPLIDDEHHGALELELQEEAWESWGREEFRRELAKRLDAHTPKESDSYSWGDDVAESLSDESLQWLFSESGESWQEESYGMTSHGFWADMSRAAEALPIERLAEATGLPLLPPDQEWRREPYPWPDGSRSPLVPSLPLHV